MQVVDMDERFSSKVMQTGDGCWLWTASVTKGGYGRYSVGNKWVRAHRYAYQRLVGDIQRLVGDIPVGLQIDHLCRVRSCVNPGHLEPVSARENILRGNGVTAVNSRKRRCNSGHNDWVSTTSGRRCRTCGNHASKAYYSKTRGAQ